MMLMGGGIAERCRVTKKFISNIASVLPHPVRSIFCFCQCRQEAGECSAQNLNHIYNAVYTAIIHHKNSKE